MRKQTGLAQPITQHFFKRAGSVAQIVQPAGVEWADEQYFTSELVDNCLSIPGAEFWLGEDHADPSPLGRGDQIRQLGCAGLLPSLLDGKLLQPEIAGEVFLRHDAYRDVQHTCGLAVVLCPQPTSNATLNYRATGMSGARLIICGHLLFRGGD